MFHVLTTRTLLLAAVSASLVQLCAGCKYGYDWCGYKNKAKRGRTLCKVCIKELRNNASSSHCDSTPGNESSAETEEPQLKVGDTVYYQVDGEWIKGPVVYVPEAADTEYTVGHQEVENFEQNRKFCPQAMFREDLFLTRPDGVIAHEYISRRRRLMERLLRYETHYSSGKPGHPEP